MSLGSQLEMPGEVALAMAMLFSAAVGSACGLRQFLLAVGATVLALFTLRDVMFLERFLRRFVAPPPGPKS